MMSKKDFGNAVQAILNAAFNKCCVSGDEGVESIVNMFNIAKDICFDYQSKELDCIQIYFASMNKLLKSDNSKYRIISENDIYKLVVIM